MQYNIHGGKCLESSSTSHEDISSQSSDLGIRHLNYFNTSRSQRPLRLSIYINSMHNYATQLASISLILLLIRSNLISNDHRVLCISDETLSNFSSDNSDSLCEIVRPMIMERHGGHLLKHFPISNCPDNLEIFIESNLSDDDFVINLVKNKRLIDDAYFKVIENGVDNLGHPIQPNAETSPDKTSTFYSNHKFLKLHNFKNNDDHCHYHGTINDNLNSTSAISIVSMRLLSGYFHDGLRNSYTLEADINSGVTILRKITSTSRSISDCRQLTGPIRTTRYRRDTSSTTRVSSKRRRFLKSNPNNKVLHGPFQSNSTSLYVQLLVVHDHSQYNDYDRNNSLIAERTMQIVNIMNAFYKQLNIFVALVGVVLWTEKDEIKLTDDGDATLTNFLKYRHEKLVPRFHHDNAQLITSTSFNGSVVGKALKGPICTYDHSGGVNTAHSHNAAIVAVTLAHELGHNLGMEHDEDEKCRCPDEKCIMSSSSSAVHPKHWSSCSIQYLEDSRKHGLLDCLTNEPVEVFGPACGNGFVEEGEDCDLGEPIPTGGTSRSKKPNSELNPTMENPCCDRMTCKFVGNATCAQGACCDLTHCSVYNGTEPKVCRQRKTVCDLEEVCDGQSEDCPTDVYYHDGIECGPTTNLADGLPPVAGSEIYNQSLAYCYNGRCASHESQCQLLWGQTASTSKDICYDQNVHGNTSGNCGFEDRIEKKYSSCEPMDAICGMLHCIHDQMDGPRGDQNRKTGRLRYGFESASILTVSFFIMQNRSKIYCNGAIIDAGPTMQDPGLVPNGAACGYDHMCLNQKCIPVHDVLDKNWCPSDCNGNGICDNTGVCHCNDGTIGTSCYQFFGSNFHLSLMLYIIMFFGPIIVILVLAFKHYREQFKIWWFLHNRKIFLKNKPRGPSQQRRTAYNVDGNKVSISEPIPLNQQQNTIQKPFYDPLIDPWAETSYDGGKSPGYRLEPLTSRSQLQHPLPPLPPPPPPALPTKDYDPANTAGQSKTAAPAITNLRPVRSAPPPPVPAHKGRPNK